MQYAGESFIINDFVTVYKHTFQRCIGKSVFLFLKISGKFLDASNFPCLIQLQISTLKFLENVGGDSEGCHKHGDIEESL